MSPDNGKRRAGTPVLLLQLGKRCLLVCDDLAQRDSCTCLFIHRGTKFCDSISCLLLMFLILRGDRLQPSALARHCRLKITIRIFNKRELGTQGFNTIFCHFGSVRLFVQLGSQQLDFFLEATVLCLHLRPFYVDGRRSWGPIKCGGPIRVSQEEAGQHGTCC